MTCSNANRFLSSTLTKRSIMVQAYLFLSLPTIIWLAGWIRPGISIPIIIAALYALYQICTGSQHSLLTSDDLQPVTRNRKYWINIILIAIAVATTGVGGIFFQGNGDPVYRNAVFYELVERSWPVQYPGEGSSILCYFTGFWLLPALIAKSTGSIFIGDLAQYLYSLWGMTIIFNFLYARHVGTAKYRILIFFLLYCGWDVAISQIFDNVTNLHDFIYQQKDLSSVYYASNTPYTLFKYNFNQSYATFIALLLIYHSRRDLSTLIFTYSLMFISAPFPAAGILPLVAFATLKHLRKSVTYQNAIGIMILLLESAYFLANNNGTHPINSNPNDGTNILFAGVIFIIFSYCIYLPWIWKSVKRDPIFWTLCAVMFFAPYLSLGGSPDFGFRLGIPFAIYFMMKVLDRMIAVKEWRKPTNALLGIIFLIGSLAPITSYRCTQLTAVEYNKSEESVTAKKWDPRTYLFSRKADLLMGKLHSEENFYYNNFIADGENFFSKYLMK